MSTDLGSHLPSDLAAALQDPALENVAVPVVTVDRQGFPHVALLSFLEICPHRHERLAFFLPPGSRTAGFLQKSGQCTLLFATESFVFYLKGTVRFAGLMEGLVVFVFRIQTALEDRPSKDEQDTYLTSALRFQAPAAEMERRRGLRRRVGEQLGAG